MQQMLFAMPRNQVAPFRGQLLKWIGNKQRFAHEIIAYFPEEFGVYYEPFLGSGAVLGTLNPERAVASDLYPPLVEIWQTLHRAPDKLKLWYSLRWEQATNGDKVAAYERIKASFNDHPNGADLLFLCRSCYGGVVRFRKIDGHMSTPCGIHTPISPKAFARRVDEWDRRTKTSEFRVADYRDVMAKARPGDLVYCDPPYTHSQTILYGAQSFCLADLFDAIGKCKQRGVYVALSIDGKKKSGKKLCELQIPGNLFAREAFVNCGPSMLKRFQMEGKSLEDHIVADRLLLTY